MMDSSIPSIKPQAAIQYPADISEMVNHEKWIERDSSNHESPLLQLRTEIKFRRSGYGGGMTSLLSPFAIVRNGRNPFVGLAQYAMQKTLRIA